MSAAPSFLHFDHATWSSELDEVELLYVAAASGFDWEKVRPDRYCTCLDEGRGWTCKDIYCIQLGLHIFHFAYDWWDHEEKRDFPPEVLAWFERVSGMVPG